MFSKSLFFCRINVQLVKVGLGEAGEVRNMYRKGYEVLERFKLGSTKLPF